MRSSAICSLAPALCCCRPRTKVSGCRRSRRPPVVRPWSRPPRVRCRSCSMEVDSSSRLETLRDWSRRCAHCSTMGSASGVDGLPSSAPGGAGARGLMTSLRFCMVTTFYPPRSFGGDAVAVQSLARALVRAGHHVTVVCDDDAFRALSGRRDTAPPEVDDGVIVHRLASRMGAFAVGLTQQTGHPLVHGSRLRCILETGRFDVIHYHNLSLVGGPAALAYGSAVKLYTAHEHWLVCPTHVLWRHRVEPCPARQCIRCQLRYGRPPQIWRHTGLLERQLGHVNAFIAVSRFSRDKHHEFGFSREMEVIPGFVRDPGPPSAAPGPSTRPYF